jgi:Glycosyl hydrolase family 46
MNLTPQQKRICERVINAFETGDADGDYGNISIYSDGPHDIRQVTYERSQTTEYSHLHELVDDYVNAHGKFSVQLKPYLNQIGVHPLVDDAQFKKLLRDAGRTDPIMQQTQDKFFDKAYWIPAMDWATANAFTEALSGLVIYDSFIHSGGILRLLRNRFPEKVPSAGGNEKSWITQYVDARQNWLANHPRKVLQNTVYRTKCLKREIARNNWDLSQLPINANDVKVS